MKRGQTTIFIILAIVIVIGIIAVYYLQQPKTDKFFGMPENKIKVDNAKNLIQVCFEDSISNGLETIGFQGGYYEKPNLAYENKTILPGFLPYYYHQGQILHPSKSVVESELGKAVDAELENCKNIDQTNLDVTLSFKTPKTKASIKENEILFNINYPVIINLEEKSTTIFKHHQITRNSALNNILELANFMTESRAENPRFDCISCIAEKAESSNLYVDVYNFDSTTTIVGIYENYTLDEQALVFLNKFE